VIHERTVPADGGDERLDRWLERELEGCSRSQVAAAIRAGRCRIEPGRAKPAYRLRGGERIVIEVPEVPSCKAVPEDLPLRVLHEDAQLVVIDKPSGMVVHPAVGHLRGTLLGGLLGRYRDTGDSPALCHRLDAGTSGVIVAARNLAALEHCQRCFRERRVRKRYLAAVHGAPRADFFEVDEPLGRHPKDFRRRCVRADGKPAKTSFVVRERHRDRAIVEARPTTGRTHQIRVHLAHAGHPVVGDPTYARGGPLDAAAPRVLLHAWSLGIEHPAGGERTFAAPIPEDLCDWIDDPALAPLD